MPTVERHHSRTKPQLSSPPKRRLTTSRASGRFAYAKYLAQGDKVPLEQVTELADPDPAPIAEWYMPPGPPRFSSGARASAPTGKANRHRQGNRAGLEGRAGGDFEQVRRRRHRSPRPRRRAAVNSSPYLDVPPPPLVSTRPPSLSLAWLFASFVSRDSLPETEAASSGRAQH